MAQCPTRNLPRRRRRREHDAERAIERAIVPSMAGKTRTTEDKDVISELAEVGEDALRRLVEAPRRIVVGTMDGLGDRFHDLATKLRGIDPLDRRLGAIETRLDALEQSKKEARTASTRAKPAPARKVSTPPVVEPGRASHDPGRPDVPTEDGPEQNEAPPGDEGVHGR
jgi:hypothetical protein